MLFKFAWMAKKLMSKTDKIEQIFDDDIVERNSWKFQYDDEELIFQMAFHVNLNKFDWKIGSK